jgi:hypothetical protein
MQFLQLVIFNLNGLPSTGREKQDNFNPILLIQFLNLALIAVPYSSFKPDLLRIFKEICSYIHTKMDMEQRYRAAAQNIILKAPQCLPSVSSSVCSALEQTCRYLNISVFCLTISNFQYA